MPFSPQRALAALCLLIALDALGAPPEAEPHGHSPPDRAEHPGRALPQRHTPGMPAHRSHPHSSQPPAQHPMVAAVPMPTHFHAVQRRAAQAWFEAPEHRGFVPPGLAKKGGMPPGLSRSWQRGQPLPADVVGYALPGSLALVLGPPPAGHRYVRVAADILLIAVGTGIVLDAMEDIAR